MGGAHRLVLLGLQAELADALHMLQAGKHIVIVRRHPDQLKGSAVERIVQLQQPGGTVRLGQICFQHAVVLDVPAVFRFLLGRHMAAQPVQDLLFQRKAGKLLHFHQPQIDGCHMGPALRLDVHHAGQIEHQQCFPHGGAADAKLLCQFTVIQRVAGLELHGDDPAAEGLVGHFARTQ